jgi:hypothetical protein
MENKVNNESKLAITAQAFYGNRTFTCIERENLSYFLLGIMDKSVYNEKRDGILDETIIELPVEGCVLVFNKYAEETINNNRNPLAHIPELNITLYSRCVLCGMDDDGNLISLTPEQNKEAIKYLSL